MVTNDIPNLEHAMRRSACVGFCPCIQSCICIISTGIVCYSIEIVIGHIIGEDIIGIPGGNVRRSSAVSWLTRPECTIELSPDCICTNSVGTNPVVRIDHQSIGWKCKCLQSCSSEFVRHGSGTNVYDCIISGRHTNTKRGDHDTGTSKKRRLVRIYYSSSPKSCRRPG